ncbi:GAF domain-containing protein [Xanthovirga aplysinae]|uniref:GAF domain-containing protein n=1 Tax=Xanthovirga aplysinae TaxID=2529853 RepID=UPI0012BBD70D|nr:GAF domain-containing protein [Xanthovirga aplysinae]MTI32017.1 GAF domain-containing protein [Xanthovirga aplysinae]
MNKNFPLLPTKKPLQMPSISLIIRAFHTIIRSGINGLRKNISSIFFLEAEDEEVPIPKESKIDLILQNNKLTLKELSIQLITNLTRSINANYGAIYILKQNAHYERSLELLAGNYNIQKKRQNRRRIQIAEGLVSHTYLQKQNKTSSLQANDYQSVIYNDDDKSANCLYTTPLISKNKVIGIIEICSAKKLSQIQKKVVKNIANNAAEPLYRRIR